MSPVTRLPGLSRFVAAVVLVVLAGGCDRYVEQASLRPDGSVAFLAEADLICSDPLHNAIFDADPCDVFTAAEAGQQPSRLPFGLDATASAEVDVEVTGERDRRTVLVRWQGPRDAFRSALVSSIGVDDLDADRSRATFSTEGAPFDSLRTSTDPAVVELRPTARWAFGEFRAIAPGVVLEHNGDRIDGRTVTWVFDDDVPDQLTLTWSTEQRSFRLWWWAVGIAILGAVLVMIVWFEGDR